MAKAEKRSKIQADKKSSREKLEKSGKVLETVVREKQEVAKASREFKRAATVEGAKRLEDAIRKAAKAANDEFKKQNEILEKKFNECKKAEQDLRERTQNAMKDAVRSKQTAEKIKETPQARAEALAAESISKEDGKWTEEQKSEREADRKKSEALRSRQYSTLNNTNLAF